MSREIWLVSEHGRTGVSPSAAERRALRDDGLQVAVYYVGPGEAIVVSRRREAVLIDGGSNSHLPKNDALGRKLANRMKADGLRLRAIIASHPHQDHTNFYHELVTEHQELFAPDAQYFDNGTVPATNQWNRLKDWRSDLPFERRTVADDPSKDGRDRIPGFAADADAHLLRGTKGKPAPDSEAVKYWSIFLFLRFRKAWLLFTGDAYMDYEEMLLDRLKGLSRRAHLLKVTHHGSSGGTSPSLVANLRPAVAVASTDSDPGHRLEADVRDRLSVSAVYTTYEGAGPGRDIFVRTDGQVRPGREAGGLCLKWRHDGRQSVAEQGMCGRSEDQLIPGAREGRRGRRDGGHVVGP